MMISKSSILENRLLQEIGSGKYPPGAAIPSRNALARKFSCSRTTVEQAVSSLVRSGIVVCRRGSGTRVLSKSPGAHRIVRLCVVAEPGIRTQGAFPLFSADVFGVPVEWIRSSAVCENLERMSVPGSAVIWMMPGEEQLFFMNFLREKGVPQLLYNRQYLNYDFVCTDALSGIREGLAWLLIEAGRDIAFVSRKASTDRPYLHPRIIAFYELCAELGAKLAPQDLFSREFADIPSGIREVGAALFGAERKSPRGIFVMSVDLAMPLVICSQNYGLTAGKDFRMLTFDEEAGLRNIPGIAMMRQQYNLFYPEILHWLSLRSSGSAEPFHSVVKTELMKG